MTALVMYANHKYRFISRKQNYTDEEALNIIEKLMQRNMNPEQFKNSRYYPNDTHSDEFLKGIQHAINIELGFAVGYIEGKLLVIKDHIMYHVSGITHSIDVNLPQEHLPVLVSMILIPLEDAITYSISMTSMPAISMGPGILDALEKGTEVMQHVYRLSDIVPPQRH